MLSSLQCGLQLLSTGEAEVEAALIGLGDQPQVQAGAVRQVWEAFQQQASRLIVPSFQMRRGHPWLVERSLWKELLELQPPRSPRDFLNQHAADIRYVEMDHPSILADLDTPQDYHNARPQS
jgi:molybdenum cofactor cytidylyltransferase